MWGPGCTTGPELSPLPPVLSGTAHAAALAEKLLCSGGDECALLLPLGPTQSWPRRGRWGNAHRGARQFKSPVIALLVSSTRSGLPELKQVYKAPEIAPIPSDPGDGRRGRRVFPEGSVGVSYPCQPLWPRKETSGTHLGMGSFREENLAEVFPGLWVFFLVHSEIFIEHLLWVLV